MKFLNKRPESNTGAAGQLSAKWISPSRADLDLRLFDSETFPICKVQEAADELEEAVKGKETWLL